MKKEQRILADYLKQKGLKQTSQRAFILDSFLSSRRHLSADELHGLIRERDPRIGFSTVYRTLRILTECGLVREVNFGDGRARFERAADRGEHGHLICTKCGRAEEFTILSVEKSIDKTAKKKRFKPENYRLDVYGYCERCV